MTGRFITLEGGEGVGKSTQVQALAEALRARGLDIEVTREPGGSEGAETIRSLLLQGAGDRWSIASEALLFAAARADHVGKTIKPALDAGRWVICDRFVDSSRAYQGAAGGLGDAAIMQLHEFGSGSFLPDRTLILDLPDDQAAARADARDGGASDRIGGRQADFHAVVVAAFRSIAAQEPERVRLVDASGPAPEVTRRLLAAIEDLLS